MKIVPNTIKVELIITSLSNTVGAASEITYSYTKYSLCIIV